MRIYDSKTRNKWLRVWGLGSMMMGGLRAEPHVEMN